jgi:hypothetical protein
MRPYVNHPVLAKWVSDLTFSTKLKKSCTISGFCCHPRQRPSRKKTTTSPIDDPRTASMPPSMPNVSNVVCSSTPTTSRTTVSTSCDGTARRDTVNNAGGSSCIMSIFASASQTPVSWRCAARHTSSSSGPGGSEMSVASAASAVIDLKRSLSAYRTRLESSPLARVGRNILR